MTAADRQAAAVERLLAEAVAQGHPRLITDPAVLDRVATVITTTDRATGRAAA